jgi:hypothetical protein
VVDTVTMTLELWWSGGSLSVQVDIVGRACYRTICICPKPKASGCKIGVTGSDL